MRQLHLALLAALLAPAALPLAQALPTPGLFCEPTDAAMGRVFPEAMQTNDFVSYQEAICGLDALAQRFPERVLPRDVVTQSVGWESLTGGHDTFDVFVVRVSDYASNVSDADKIRIVFQLSIHGNEKGGREGGLRVIEDLARGIGVAAEHPEMVDHLSFMELLFVFPNPDGWTHEEVEYRQNDACYLSATNQCGETGVETQSFVRVNGHGKDVNRQWPTIGWVREAYTPMSEPEAQGLVAYLKAVPNVRYASDIHGMLNPADGTTAGIECAPGDVPPDVMGFDPTCFGSAVDGSKGHFV
ncbi:MAG TPA: M14 family zinc carboxypeptidase, partial [Candidatus Thermoplasmatota archaeon]|nr:M14 family zinc carboxypeptidase [Candidatus Thermoplasmatota archaeon]